MDGIPPLHSASPPPLHPESPPPFCDADDLVGDIDEAEDLDSFPTNLETVIKSNDCENTNRITSKEEIERNVLVSEASTDVSKTDSINSSAAVFVDESTEKNLNYIHSSLELICESTVNETVKPNIESFNSSVNEYLIGTSVPKIDFVETVPLTNEFSVMKVTDDFSDKMVSDFDVEKEAETSHFSSNENDVLGGKCDSDHSIIQNEITENRTLNLEFSSNHFDLNSNSSSDSSPVINESAFIVNNEPNICTDKSTNDDFLEFVDFKVEKSSNNLDDLCFDNHSASADQVISDDLEYQGNDNLFSSVFDTKAPSVMNSNDKVSDFAETDIASDDWVAVSKVTSDNDEILDSNASSIRPDSSVFLNDDANDLDDEFSDFVSPVSHELKVISEKTNQRQSTTCESVVDDNVAPLPANSSRNSSVGDVTENWTEIFAYSGENPVEVNLNTIEGKLNGSSVWCKIKNVESSPALRYNWNNSESNKILLTTLSVDSRNVLFGPRWNSEVPRFASNLGFNPLVPQKTVGNNTDFHSSTFADVEPGPETKNNEPDLATNETVRDAHFDWNDSGLTNPLETHSHSTLLDLDLLANFDIHSPYYKEKRKSKKLRELDVTQLDYAQIDVASSSLNNGLSTNAENILNNLPNLLVMEKQYIVFPMR